MGKPRLKNTLKNLRAIDFDRSEFANAMMAPQEMLDFLAVAAGIKSVFLLGRGFDDKAWVEGALQCASDFGLHIIKAAPWAYRPAADIPSWYYEAEVENEMNADVHYISKSPATARAVQGLSSTEVSPDVEAKLLGYPLCCVAHHHEIQTARDRLFYLLLERHSGGDIKKARRLIQDDVSMAAETPEEIAAAELTSKPPVSARFTSFIMCDACIRLGSKSPAAAVTRQMYEFSASIDDALTQELARISRMSG